MKDFARSFRVTYPDGTPEDMVLYGVQFPSGRCVLDDTLQGFVLGAVSFEALNLPPGSVVEWADEPARHGFTMHGHHCCEKAPHGPRPATVARCGGPKRCDKCRASADGIHSRGGLADGVGTGKTAGSGDQP